MLEETHIRAKFATCDVKEAAKRIIARVDDKEQKFKAFKEAWYREYLEKSPLKWFGLRFQRTEKQASKAFFDEFGFNPPGIITLNERRRRNITKKALIVAKYCVSDTMELSGSTAKVLFDEF